MKITWFLRKNQYRQSIFLIHRYSLVLC